MVRCDERCLRQIVLNLGSNAVKYAGRGAQVQLVAKLETPTQAVVGLHAAAWC
jgi:signal transduction histidine kinase